MKHKTFILILILLVSFHFGTLKTSAATATISVTPSSTRVLVGSTITVTVKVSSAAPLGGWNFDVLHSSNLKMTYSSFQNSLYVADVATSTNQKSKSYTFKFTAKSSGTASIAIRNSYVLGYDEKQMTVTNGSRTISIITQAQLEASYSKNNNLSTLSISGASLSPEFNKDTLEYTAELDPDTTKANVSAEVEDKKASVTGVGEIEVTDGVNRHEVKVTAENGSVKTYVINVIVKEYNPIEVKIGDETYTVVRKKSLLEAPRYYKETTITLRDEEIPAFTNDITKFTLVGLKDDEGNIDYYIYDEDKYTPYMELSFDRVVFYPMEEEGKGVSDKYKKATVTYDGKQIDAYKIEAGSRFALIYGMNLETGKKDYYLYDTEENTLQYYNSEEIDLLNETNNKYFIIIIILATVSLISVISSIVLLVIMIKKKKQNKGYKMDDLLEATQRIKTKKRS